MRVRWYVELPDADPDAAVIRACLAQLPSRRRADLIRKLLAASCRVLLRRRQTPTAPPERRAEEPRPTKPARPSRPAHPVAEPDAAEHRRLAALAQRLRVSFVSGGLRYDDTADFIG